MVIYGIILVFIRLHEINIQSKVNASKCFFKNFFETKLKFMPHGTTSKDASGHNKLT